MSLYCFNVLYDNFYLVRDATDWFRGLEIECRLRMNVRKARIVRLRSLKMVAILPREHEMFYQAVQVVWCDHKGACTLGIPTPDASSYMTDNVHSGTVLERGLT